jgi:hypothetical protein
MHPWLQMVVPNANKVAFGTAMMYFYFHEAGRNKEEIFLAQAD